MALKFDPKKSALIIQDLQNDVIMPGGAFTKPDASPAEHAKKQNVVGNVKALAVAAKKLHRDERVEKVGDAARVEF